MVDGSVGLLFIPLHNVFEGSSKLPFSVVSSVTASCTKSSASLSVLDHFVG